LDGPWWINGPDAPCSLPHKAHSQRLSDAGEGGGVKRGSIKHMS
jgi:hypothetical protein